MSAQTISALQSPLGFGRVSHAVGMVDIATENSAGQVGMDDVNLPPPHERDLVAKLINDPKNKKVWEALLNNKFCRVMKEASIRDNHVLRGFEWYMKQDYHYVAGLIGFETDRFTKAETSSDFETMIDRVSRTVRYTGHFFKVCTDAQPHGLGINASAVLKIQQCEALKEYLKLFTKIAEEEDDVFSMVAMIVSLQSYYKIAEDVYKYSVHRDTLWYKFWAKDNFSLGEPALVQQRYFIDNYAAWKDCYEKASEIFRETCRLELALWDEAMNHSVSPA